MENKVHNNYIYKIKKSKVLRQRPHPRPFESIPALRPSPNESRTKKKI